MATIRDAPVGKMPNFHRSIQINEPRNEYFLKILDYLPLEGFEIRAINRSLLRIQVQRRAKSIIRSTRYIIWLYGNGARTRVLFGVYPPKLLSLFSSRNAEIFDKLRDMESILEAAQRHTVIEPTAALIPA